ncbi:unnamed protein product [Oppiella nova]|uniref:Uncharacterized protein n=1 Tax=Oppiella nova TaxID=334625 RepID=A0A7R9LM83_9ACAR|nr:unnamed protein product [Oppiella nova]CAG2165036.1 unnamed protein product [Oppiella nova]
MYVIKRYRNPSDTQNDKTSDQTLDNHPGKHRESVTNTDICNDPGDQSKLFDKYPKYRWPAILISGVFVGSFNLVEASYFTFASTYFQYCPLKVSATKAMDVITTFTTPYTVFRGLSIFVAIKLSSKYMLIIHHLVCVIGIICLVFGRSNMTMLYVANVVMGIGLSAIMHSIFAFVGQHIRMTNMVGTVPIVFMSSFNILPPYLIGLYIKSFSDMFILFEALMLGAMCFTAIGSVLTEMVDILQTTTQYMTMFSTFTSTGFLIGSLCGFLIKYLNRQLILAVFLVIMAIGTAFIPHSPNLYILYTCAIGLGMGSGIINCVVNVWIIEMWLQKSAPVLQIPGLTFGLGTIVSPLLLKPFLRDKYSGDSDTTTTGPGITVSTPDSVTYAYNEDYEEHRRSLLKTPFLILGIIQMIFPILLIIMYVIKRYRNSSDTQNDNTLDPKLDDHTEKHRESYTDIDNDPGDQWKLFDKYPKYRWPAILLGGVFVGSFNLVEASYYTFASTYFQYCPLKVSATKAMDVITAFTTPYTVFRGLSIFVAIKLSSKYMLIIHHIVCVIGIVCLVFGRSNMTMLYVANVMMGIGISAIIQSIFAFVGQHIRMTDMVGTVLIVFMSSFNILPPYLIGLYIKSFSDMFILFEALMLGRCSHQLLWVGVVQRCSHRSLEHQMLWVGVDQRCNHQLLWVGVDQRCSRQSLELWNHSAQTYKISRSSLAVLVSAPVDSCDPSLPVLLSLPAPLSLSSREAQGSHQSPRLSVHSTLEPL